MARYIFTMLIGLLLNKVILLFNYRSMISENIKILCVTMFTVLILNNIIILFNNTDAGSL